MRLSGDEIGHALRVRATRSQAIDQIREAAVTCGGNLVHTADMLDLPVRTLEHWRHTVPQIGEIFAAARAGEAMQRLRRSARLANDEDSA